MKSDALAFWLKTPISSPHCVDRHRALSPCAARKAAFLSQKSCRDRKRAESQNAVSLEKVDSRRNEQRDKSTPARRILGFAMRKPAKRCKAKPQQVSLANLCFASRVSEIRLERLSSSRGAAIKGLSRKTSEAVGVSRCFFSKAESIKKTTPIILMALLLSACTTTKEAVYIPTKCKTKDIPKPMPSKESSVSEDVAEILKYTEMLERDLEFCKGDGQ